MSSENSGKLKGYKVFKVYKVKSLYRSNRLYRLLTLRLWTQKCVNGVKESVNYITYVLLEVLTFVLN